MSISSEVPRSLPFPLQDSTSIVRAIPTTSPTPIVPFEWQTEDASEIVSIRLDLSQDEYTALANAVDVGSDIAYNQDAMYIWDVWTKAFRGAIDAMNCEDVADCIETSQSVRDAIAAANDNYGVTDPDYLSPTGTESTTIINNRFPPTKRNESIKEPPAECDKDALWSGILEVVIRIDEQGRQFLETVVSKADVWERVIEFAGTVPIVGELAENVLTTFVQEAQNILNLYNSHSSTEALEDIACDLFEMVCAECRYPTYEEIADYYASFAIEDMQDWANIGLKFMVDYLTGSSSLAALVAYFSVNTFQLWVMYAQSTFVGARGTKNIAIWANIGEDNPNNGWELLCDGCANETWCYRYDFTALEALPAGLSLVSQCGTVMGVLTEGVGLVAQATTVCDPSTDGMRAVWLRFTIENPPTVAGQIMTVRWKGSGVKGNTNDGSRWTNQDDSHLYNNGDNDPFYAGDEIALFDRNWAVDELELRIWSAQSGSTGGSVILEYVEFSGYGVNPFDAATEDNCVWSP